ncbi:MAG TPA: tetratricopeptide repeat protein [Negativicutes bacterium]|nr:tetratricopeptide repeat protein [Negativicutes bacterium]
MSAAKLKKNYLEPRVELGRILLELKRFEEASECFAEALALKQDDGRILHWLALAADFQGHDELAAEYYARSVRARLDSAITRANWGKLLLRAGDFEAGFRESEWRQERQDFNLRYKNKPFWRGEVFSGKRLLVESEQGLGDVIHFCRYLPLVKRRGGITIFSAWRGLMNLFAGLAGVDILIEHKSAVVPDIEFDLVVPLLSLPHIFGTTMSTVPQTSPYLTADPQLCSQWRNRLPTDKKFKVGLVWAARMTNEHSLKRSCGLAVMARLFAIEGVAFVSLQKGEGEKQCRLST